MEMGQNMGQIVRQQNFQRSPNLISICVDEIRNGELSGSLYHCYSEEACPFSNVAHLIELAENLFDQIKFPQASTQMRTFTDKSLGMVQEPPLGASGQAGFDFGVFRNQDANSRLYYNIPIAIRDTINYVIFSPIDQCEFNPDVVVFVGDSDMADIVMRATSYISGDLWESKSSSVLSCAWTYMYTWLSGKVNHCQTGMHHGMGRRKVYPKGLHIVSVPYQKLDEVCLALRQMDWQLISFRPNDKDQDELRRRMRNWNALSKQINESYSFALPENKVQK